MMKKRTLTILVIAGVVLAVAVGAALFPTLREAWIVNRLVARNIEARGGQEAWDEVEALRFTGSMEIGRGLNVPFVLEQKVPDKTCLEYVFDGDVVIQCSDADQGWKIVPFKGKSGPQALTEDEHRDASVGADPRGLLVDYRARGHKIELIGSQQLDGVDVEVIRVTLPRGGQRELYLDAETGLERKVVSTRMLAKRERRVDTVYSDWKESDGLLFPRLQVTRTEGDDESHLLVVKKVEVNPEIDDIRFLMPVATTQ